jgi:hypothetical protein
VRLLLLVQLFISLSGFSQDGGALHRRGFNCFADYFPSVDSITIKPFTGLDFNSVAHEVEIEYGVDVFTGKNVPDRSLISDANVPNESGTLMDID